MGDNTTTERPNDVATHMLDVKRATTDDFVEPCTVNHVEKRRYIKNLLVLTMAFFFLWSAYSALRNLQSSLYAAGGLGLYSLSSIYCSLFIGSLFSTTIVQRLQPKRTLSLCLTGYVLYTAANFYPRFYTMIPASVIQGFFETLSFTAFSTYLAKISAGYADLAGKQTSHVFSQFLGVFFLFFKCSQVAGGLMSSLLLSKTGSHKFDIIHADRTYTKHGNDSLDEGTLYRNITNENNIFAFSCGKSYCPSDGVNTESDSGVDETTLLILMSCFGASTVVGSMTIIFFLDSPEVVMKKTSARFSQQMMAVFHLCRQRRNWLAFSLSFYYMFQAAFSSGVFTKAYITCAIGVHYVGFLLMTFATTSGIAGYISGHLHQTIGRISLILTGMCLHLTMFTVMYFWSPSEQTLHLFFIVLSLWGIGDGILINQITSLLGTLFEANKEAGFAAHEMFQALGGFSLLTMALYLCTDVIIIINMSVLLVAMSAYVTLEVLLRAKKDKPATAEKIPLTNYDTDEEDDDINL